MFPAVLPCHATSQHGTSSRSAGSQQPQFVMDFIYRLRLKLYDPRTSPLRALEFVGEGGGEARNPTCLPQPLISNAQFLDYFDLSKEAPTCQNWRVFGEGDGIEHTQHVCLDAGYHIMPKDCLVFSYGITNWSFEDDFDNFGCQVYALDPLLPLEKQRLSPNAHFLDIGLASFTGRNKAKVNGRDVFFSVTRLENLMADLKLGAAVDYLKLDVAGGGEEILQDVLLSSPHILHHIKQISMTLHHHPYTATATILDSKSKSNGKVHNVSLHYETLWAYIQLLHCQDFKLLWSRPVGLSAHDVVWGRLPKQEDMKEFEEWALPDGY